MIGPLDLDSPKPAIGRPAGPRVVDALWSELRLAKPCSRRWPHKEIENGISVSDAASLEHHSVQQMSTEEEEM